jgi:hypothetical protein
MSTLTNRDRLKHKLIARIAASKELRELLAKTPVHVPGEAPDNSVINSITDVASATVNDLLTPGGIANIKGNHIKITGSKPGIGLFFTSQATQQQVAVPSNSIGTNDPSKISFVIPAALDKGEYLLSIVTQYSGGGVRTLWALLPVRDNLRSFAFKHKERELRKLRKRL